MLLGITFELCNSSFWMFTFSGFVTSNVTEGTMHKVRKITGEGERKVVIETLT